MPALAKPAAEKTAVAKPAAAPAAKKTEPPKKMVRKKMTVQKATTCDLCTDLSVPSCVYACPHDAAKRVEPQTFFATGGKGWSFRKKTRTTH
jgi:Fe-S-cluster-containing hydrogenase component 2